MDSAQSILQSGWAELPALPGCCMGGGPWHGRVLCHLALDDEAWGLLQQEASLCSLLCSALLCGAGFYCEHKAKCPVVAPWANRAAPVFATLISCLVLSPLWLALLLAGWPRDQREQQLYCQADKALPLA